MMIDRFKKLLQAKIIVGLIIMVGIGVIGSYLLGSSNAQTPTRLQPTYQPLPKANLLRPYSLGTAPYQYIAYTGSLDQTRIQTGINNYFAAFIISSGSCTPSWDGTATGTTTGLRATALKQDFANLKAAGGDVIISFGGANGSDLATSCLTVDELVNAYRGVIQMYGVGKLDFDIEGSTLSDTAGNNRRAAAVAILQNELPDLKIWLTLPVHRQGLTTNGLAVVRGMRDAGVTVNGINIMAMNYNIKSTDMGRQAVSSATKTFDQIKSLYPTSDDATVWKSLGITVMIGQNDTASEIFTLNNARTVRAFVVEKNVGLLSQWNVSRDQTCNSGVSLVKPRIDCSGVTQAPYEFLKILTIPSKPEPK